MGDKREGVAVAWDIGIAWVAEGTENCAACGVFAYCRGSDAFVE